MRIIPRLESFNPNFYYLLKKDIDYSIYIEDKKLLFVSKMNMEYAKKLFKNLEIVDLNSFYKYVKKSTPEKIFLDFKGSSISLYKKLNEIAEVVDLGEKIEKKRARKSRKEKHYIKKAVEISKEIFEELKAEIKKGVKEKDIEKSLIMKMYEKGVEPSFSPIVADLSNAKYPHYRTGEKRIEKGVLIDFGVKYNNYCSDLTRSIVFDKRRKEYKVYEELKDIFYSIVDNLKDIEYAGELALLSSSLFKKHKLPLPPHLIGHGIGLEVHEKPLLSENSKDKLLNTVLAIEPAYYKRFGLRYEENVIVNKGKVEVL